MPPRARRLYARAPSPGERLIALVRAEPPDRAAIAAFLDGERVRFCRPPRGTDELWGYNHQALAWLTGPGHVVVHEDRARGAAVDYREVPPQRPPNWPEVRPNDRGFSRFVFRDMVGYMRRVARDVFIGSAPRGGKETGNYLVLCREQR